MAESGYVYFVHAVGTNRVKIGRTENLSKNLAQLTSGQSPFPLQLLWARFYRDMHQAERMVHHLYRAYRVHGQWFEFPQTLLSMFYLQDVCAEDVQYCFPGVGDGARETKLYIHTHLLSYVAYRRGPVYVHELRAYFSIHSELRHLQRAVLEEVLQGVIAELVKDGVLWPGEQSKGSTVSLQPPSSPIPDFPSQLLQEEA